MPLHTLSPNIQEPNSPSRKRTLEEFAGMEPGTKNIEGSRNLENKENGLTPTPKDSIPPPVEASPASLKPSSSNLADPKPISPKPTPPQNTISAFFSPTPKQLPPQPSPSVDNKMARASLPADHSATTHAKRKLENDENSPLPPASTQGAPGSTKQPDEPPPKKKRATKEESETKKKEAERLKQEKEALKAAEFEAKKKEADRLKQEKEALKAAKAAEKAAKEAEAAAEKRAKAEERERKRQQKEDEEAKKAAEKEKKARSQPTLGSFFKMPAVSKEKKPDILKTANPTTSPEKPATEELSIYEQLFKPFFVKEHVTLAPIFYMDDESREAKTRIFEEYVEHKRGDVEVKPFKPLDALELPFIIPRGQTTPTVRSAMAEFNENSSRKPVDLTSESQNSQIRNIREVLHEIPMKLLCFKEDVRPPYYGTVTDLSGGLASLRKLARNPVAKDVLPLNYDYDSEAEWQDDDGEDVDLQDDEEDDVDNDDDMDDFLDDSDDVGLTRLPLVSGLEPESSGICWENRKRLGPSAHMYKFRMEFMLDTLDHHSGIDPFSTEYWAQPKPTTAPAALAPNASKANSIMKTMAPPAPADALKMLAASAANAPHKGRAATVVLKPDMVQKLKDMVVAKKGLSKVGIVELFGLENKVPKSAIKNTLEIIAMKAGKDWVLRPDA